MSFRRADECAVSAALRCLRRETVTVALNFIACAGECCARMGGGARKKRRQKICVRTLLARIVYASSMSAPVSAALAEKRAKLEVLKARAAASAAAAAAAPPLLTVPTSSVLASLLSMPPEAEAPQRCELAAASLAGVRLEPAADRYLVQQKQLAAAADVSARDAVALRCDAGIQTDDDAVMSGSSGGDNGSSINSSGAGVIPVAYANSSSIAAADAIPSAAGTRFAPAAVTAAVGPLLFGSTVASVPVASAADGASQPGMEAGVALRSCSVLLDARVTGLAVADLAWSPYAGGLLAAAFAPANDGATVPAALVWALAAGVPLPSAPAAVGMLMLAAPAAPLGGDVTALRFHPHAPHVLLAGTSAGQVVAWDMRATDGGGAPAAASGLAAAGVHQAPVTAILVAGTPLASLILSFSVDGRVCLWDGGGGSAGSLPPLSDGPTASARLAHAAEGGGVASAAAPRDLVVACASLCAADASRVFVGGLEGGLYATVFTGGAAPAVIARAPAHYALIAALAAHPARDVPLLLTASHDGTVKLWSTEAAARGAPPSLLDTFDGCGGGAMDSVADAAWSPTHPAVFAAADLGGRVALFNVLLNAGSGATASVSGDSGASVSMSASPSHVAAPAAEFSCGTGATRLRFAPDGTRLAVGTLDAGIVILTVPENLAAPSHADETSLVAELYAPRG